MSIYKINNVEDIVERLENVLQPNQALVTLINGSVGIATENERGFHPTHFKFDTTNYNTIDAMVNEANRCLFPNRAEVETAKIVLSSMRKN